MMKQKYIIPLFFSSKLFCQNDETFDSSMEFGISHATYINACFQRPTLNLQPGSEIKKPFYSSPVCETQFGFSLGWFIWKPLTEALAIRPTIETAFSNLCLHQLPKVRAKSLDINFSAPMMIALKKPNKQGIIYLARNMSCYLTTKQPYLIVGPKLNFKQFDKGFRHKGFQNERWVGALIGYGIQYEFHGTKIAPEITYSFEVTQQNKITTQQKITHAITLTINVF
jgi:hypothetical protein